MKKIVFLTLGILIFLIPCISFADTAKCTYDSNNSISTNLDECLKNNSQLVDGSKADINGGFKTKVNSWTESLALFLGVLAVGTIVYGAFLLTLSAGEDEKVKKAKDIIKWGIIGFLGVISASGIIFLIVNIMYSIGV